MNEGSQRRHPELFVDDSEKKRLHCVKIASLLFDYVHEVTILGTLLFCKMLIISCVYFLAHRLNKEEQVSCFGQQQGRPNSKYKQQKVMNSYTLNNIGAVKRRFILAIGILVGISTLVLADPVMEEARLSKEEANELICLIKKELKVDTYQPTLVFDEEGMFEETKPLQIIKVYDDNDELLLEAPIRKLQESKNKHLRKLLNASDFLTEYEDTKYYRLDI